jgi:hypothetical protein
MKIKIKLNQTLAVNAIFLLIIFLANDVFSQALIRDNRLWGEVTENGGNKGVTYTNGDLNLFADYDAYGCRFQGTEGFFSGFVCIATDKWNGSTAVFSPIEKDQTNGQVVSPLENYTRYADPAYTITSGATTTSPPSNDLGGADIDPSKCIGTSDQTVMVTNKYSCGVTVKRKVLTWGQNLDNNYSIIDLTFENDTTITFTNFYVFLHNGEYTFQAADGRNPSVAAADQYANNNTPRRWYHYYGAKNTDSLRVYYYYSSDDPEISGDRIGQPLTVQGGRLLDYDFTFVATLFASKQPYTPTSNYTGAVDQNDQNDMDQPTVTTVANMQNVLNLGLFNSQYDPTGTDASNYYNLINGTTLSSEDMTGADIRPGHHRINQDEEGKNAPGGEPGISPLSNSFESMITCYGPYTFAPGQQIRIVTATGIAGISRTKAVQVGEEWYNDTKNGTSTLTDPPNLPDPTTGYFPSNFVFPDNATETDKKKDRWVSTGIDSLHLTVSKAKWNFLHDYNAPETPPPPTSLSVAGTGQGIQLKWSDPAAEGMTNFIGYRVMKKLGNTDTTYYQEVFRSDTASNKDLNTYTDPRIRVGAFYYYYVQAMEKVPTIDTNAYPSERGKIIYSGRVYFYNNTQVKGEGLVNESGNLNKIAIVPNPFNWNDPYLRGYNITNPSNLQISFYELPKRVTIKIFTESGNLVKTIEHNGDFGNEDWNMTNENGQTIASGVYIVLFQTPDGGTAYQKLVVAR